MKEPLRWGILGTSFISAVMAEAINANEESEIYAVAGRNQDTLAAFAKQHAISSTFTDYDALIQDEHVDIVYIALPNHLHHPFIVKAAEAGKAILCEKSLSVDMEKTELALNAVKKHKVFFAEGLMYLNHPFSAAIQHAVAEGKIGKLRSINASYSAAISQFVNPDSKGTLYNLACYPVSLIYRVLQSQLNPQQQQQYDVSAYGRRGADGNICEISGLIRYSDDLVVRVHSAEDYGLHPEFTLLGSKGSLTINSNPWLPTTTNTMTITEYEKPGEQITINAEGDAFYYQVKNIVSAIQQGALSLAQPAADIDDSYQIMKLLTTLEHSASFTGN